MWAAAWTHVTGFAILAVTVYFYSEKWYPIPYEWRRLLLIVLAAGLTLAAAWGVGRAFGQSVYMPYRELRGEHAGAGADPAGLPPCALRDTVLHARRAPEAGGCGAPAERPAAAPLSRPWPPLEPSQRRTPAIAPRTSAPTMSKPRRRSSRWRKSPTSTSSKVRTPLPSHDAHAAQEAPRGRQPVPAHGQRRHHARGALSAPPPGVRLGAGGARGEGRRAGGRAARRARGPYPGAVAQAAPRRRQAQHARQQLGQRARPLRHVGRAGRAQGARHPARRALRRHLLELAAAQRASCGGHAGAPGRSAVAGRLP